MAYHYTEEAGTERLLLITLDAPRGFDSEFRHISARVVRRALSDVKAEGQPTQYNDGPAAQGYRWADWSSGKATTTIRVSDLRLRGQMSVRSRSSAIPYGDGKPYDNALEFSCDVIRAKDAKQIADAFLYMERRRNKLLAQGHVFNSDSYADQVRAMALILGIKKVLFPRATRYGCADLSDAASFIERATTDVQQELDRLIEHAKNN